MKLLDTSVWIPFLRRKGDPAVKQRVANLIAANEAAYTCPVWYELVSGALDQELQPLLKGLSFATRLELRVTHWDLAAESGRTLRKAGITLPIDDLLIATVAVQSRIPIMCRDRHFTVIQSEIYHDLRVEQL